MQKRMAGLLGATLILLAACSGGTPTDDVLPTLAQLPTAVPTATLVPATMTSVASPVFTDVPTEIPVSTALATKTVADATAELPNAPDEPTATFLPIPDSSQPSLFPTLVAGEDTTLQGQLTLIDDTHATLTDSEGHTVTVLIDPFAAQIGANQMVQIRGTVETEGDKLVLRMTEIKVMTDATTQPLPTAT